MLLIYENITKAKNKGTCAECHVLDPGPGDTPTLFTDFTYDNLGIPKNLENSIINLLIGCGHYFHRFLTLFFIDCKDILSAIICKIVSRNNLRHSIFFCIWMIWHQNCL